MIGMKMVIYMASEAFRAMKPRARPNEDATRKPFRAVVAVRSTSVRGNVVITVRTDRRRAYIDPDADLGPSGGGG